MTTGFLFRGGTVLGPQGEAFKATVAIEGSRIVAVGKEAERRGKSRSSSMASVDLRGAYLAPGFVDLHTHGALGIDFYAAESAELDRVVEEHYLPHGVTRFLISLYPGPRREFLRVVGRVAESLRQGTGQGAIGGIHLEGPFLDPEHPGALPVRHFRRYNARALDELLDAGGGFVRTMTIAPERPGGRDLLRHLKKRKVVPAFGHSGADYDQTREALDAGLDYVTHLFNAMDGIHHRRPGPVLAFLERDGVRLELISDGYHVDPAVLRWVAAIKDPEQLCLVSDSVSPCGLRPGRYRFAEGEVRLHRGRVTLSDGTLAGSALTMDVAFGVQVKDIGLAPARVSVSASWTPARIVGWHRQIGQVSTGKRADLVVLGRDLRVCQTYLAGQRVFDRS